MTQEVASIQCRRVRPNPRSHGRTRNPAPPKSSAKKKRPEKATIPPRGRDFALASKHTRAPNVYRQSDPFIWPIPSAYIYRGSRGGRHTRLAARIAPDDCIQRLAPNGPRGQDPEQRRKESSHTLSRSPIPWPSFIPRVRIGRRASRSRTQTRRHAALARCFDESASHAGGSGGRMGKCYC